MGRRAVSLAIAAGLSAAGFAIAAETATQARRADAARLMNELMSGKGVGGEFTLSDAKGRAVRLADFRGKLVLLYFGFTTCPDVCPTDLLAIARAIQSLGKDGDAIQPIFITLDPERDTREVIGPYAASFHPRFVALTGTASEVGDVARAYKVFFEKVAVPGSITYTIDHAAFTFLLDTGGKYVGMFPPGTPWTRIATILRDEIGK